MSENNTDALNEQYGESSFEAAQDAQDVDKALIDYCHGQEPSHRFSPITILDLKAFATYYAQRCGVVINEKSKTMKTTKEIKKLVNEKQCPKGHGKMKKIYLNEKQSGIWFCINC